MINAFDTVKLQRESLQLRHTEGSRRRLLWEKSIIWLPYVNFTECMCPVVIKSWHEIWWNMYWSGNVEDLFEKCSASNDFCIRHRKTAARIAAIETHRGILSSPVVKEKHMVSLCKLYWMHFSRCTRSITWNMDWIEIVEDLLVVCDCVSTTNDLYIRNRKTAARIAFRRRLLWEKNIWFPYVNWKSGAERKSGAETELRKTRKMRRWRRRRRWRRWEQLKNI